MMWHKFGSKHAKILTADELKEQVLKLKAAEEKTRDYAKLQNEREKLLKDIKKEGWNIRHRKALNRLHSIEHGIISTGSFFGKEAVLGAKYGLKKYKSRRYRRYHRKHRRK